MLALQGYFQSGRFVTDTPVQIPERKKAIVTVLDEEKEQEAHRKLWAEIIDDLQKCDEVLEGKPECLHFRSPEETEAL
jgi:ethanolamine utilization cobalamin adenosyltransferase